MIGLLLDDPSEQNPAEEPATPPEVLEWDAPAPPLEAEGEPEDPLPVEPVADERARIQASMPAGVLWIPGHGFRLGGPGARVQKVHQGAKRPGYFWREAWQGLSVVARAEYARELEPIRLRILAEEKRMREAGEPFEALPAEAVPAAPAKGRSGDAENSDGSDSDSEG